MALVLSGEITYACLLWQNLVKKAMGLQTESCEVMQISLEFDDQSKLALCLHLILTSMAHIVGMYKHRKRHIQRFELYLIRN
jgi:hypothetical protein